MFYRIDKGIAVCCADLHWGPLGVNHGLLNPAHGSILPPLLAIIYSAPIRPSLSGGNKQRHVKKKLFKENIPTTELFVQ